MPEQLPCAYPHEEGTTCEGCGRQQAELRRGSLQRLRVVFPFVVVESPYAGNIARNAAYARAAVRDCLLRGEAPYASHLLYTQPGVLRDEVPEERRLGMAAGHAIATYADRLVVYLDLGVSPGMAERIELARSWGMPVEERRLGAGWESAAGSSCTGCDDPTCRSHWRTGCR